MTDHQVIACERLDFRFVPRAWRYAQDNRAAMDAHFAEKQRARPAIWNGRVLAAHEHSVSDGVSRGAYLETDYASFDAWREWRRPAAGVWDCFSAAVVQGSDGAFLAGVMAPHTANAGQVYFPCGTPDPGDVIDGRVDLEGSALRELKEETGLDPGTLEAVAGWLVVISGAVVLHAKILRSRQPAETLRRQVLDHLATQRQPELCDIHLVRGLSGLDPRMPPYMAGFLRHIWR